MAVLDKDDIQWITVKGNHIPIKEGENKEEAIKSFFESKSKEGGKTSTQKAEKKSSGIVNHKSDKNPSGYKYPAIENMTEEQEKRFVEKTYPRVKKILSKAYMEEPEITRDLESIKGIKLHGLDFRRKSKKSAVGKINRERLETPALQNVSDRTIMSKMYDLVRYTQEVDKDKFVEQAQKTIDTLKKKGYKVVQLKNFWLPEVHKNSNPYRGINMKWISPNGQKFEFQFNTANNLKVKNEMHDIYEKTRNMKDGEEKTALNNKSLELTKMFDNPKGIEKLKA